MKEIVSRIPSSNTTKESAWVPSGALALPAGVTIAETGLMIPKEIKHEDFLRFGKQLRTLQNASQWWIADFILHAQDFASDADQPRKARVAIYQRVEKLFPEYARQTLKIWASVARRVPQHIRSPHLSFDHHVHIASLHEEFPQLQASFIKRAEELECTAEDLRLIIADTRRGHVIETPKSKAPIQTGKQLEQSLERGTAKRAANVPRGTMEVVAPEPELMVGSHSQLAGDVGRSIKRLVDWYRAEGKKTKPEQWTKERKAALMRDLKPAIDGAHALAELTEALCDSRNSGEWA